MGIKQADCDIRSLSGHLKHIKRRASAAGRRATNNPLRPPGPGPAANISRREGPPSLGSRNNPLANRPPATRFLRSFWTHRTRRELAQGFSCDRCRLPRCELGGTALSSVVLPHHPPLLNRTSPAGRRINRADSFFCVFWKTPTTRMANTIGSPSLIFECDWSKKSIQNFCGC